MHKGRRRDQCDTSGFPEMATDSFTFRAAHTAANTGALLKIQPQIELFLLQVDLASGRVTSCTESKSLNVESCDIHLGHRKQSDRQLQAVHQQTIRLRNP